MSLSLSLDSRIKLFAGPQTGSYEPGLTGHGLKGQSLVNDATAFLRMATSLPISSWTVSKYYPDAPNSFGFQVMGFTTATHAPYGALNLYRTAQSIKRSFDIGDKKGFPLDLMGLGASLGQTGLGVGFAGIRSVNIASVVQPNNPLWETLGRSWGYLGSVGGTLLYAVSALCELFAIDFSFSQKYQKKDSIAYMRKRLGVDFDALQRKALANKSEEELEKEGRSYLQEFAKADLALLRKHGFAPQAQTAEEFIAQCLSAEDIKEAGRISLTEKLQEKKINKMSRAIGAEGVRALIRYFNESSDVTKEEVDKIVLSNLENTNGWRYFRGAVSVAGAAAMICLLVFTEGTPLLISSALFTAVALGEMVIAMCGLRQQSSMHDTAPGAIEKLVPYLGIAGTIGAVAVMCSLASVYSFGIAPLAFSLALAAVSLGLYGYHIYTIDERREAHSFYLMDKKKGELSLDEFKYICTHLSNIELAKHSPLERLNRANSEAVREFMRRPETVSKSWKDTLLYGVNQQQAALEKDYVRQLWTYTKDSAITKV